MRAAGQVERLERELADLDRRIGSSAGSVARRFDAVLGLLEAWGFVRDWSLTDRGELLVRTYHESDLLLAEAVARGLFDDLDPPAVAALASCVTYEHRSRIPPPPPWFPSADVRGRFEQLERIGRDLQAAERKAELPETRLPDPTFAALAHAWASGTDLATVLDDEDLSGGDFVRNIRQLIDLLRQLAGSAPVRETRSGRRLGGRRAVPRRGGGVVAHRHQRRRRRAHRPRRHAGGVMPVRPGEAWGSEGVLPPDGVVVRTDAEARTVVEGARAGRPGDPRARPAGRRPVPHPRGHR